MATQPKRSTTPNAETRQRLINAGVRLFAEHGYRGVSVRDLSAAAAVNIAAVTYHFGGKEGLYQAIFTAILDADEESFGESVANMNALIDRANGDFAQLRAVVDLYVAGMLAHLTANEEARWFGVLVTRELAFPAAAFDLLYRRRAEPYQRVLAKIIAQATGAAATSEAVRIQAFALGGMIVNFGFSRTILWRRMAWKNYTPERVAQVKQTAADLICAALGFPAPRSSSTSGEK